MATDSAPRALKAAFKAASRRNEARAVDDEERGLDDSVPEALSKDVFSTYVCRTIKQPQSRPHPGDIAEATSLSAISLPHTDYPLFNALPPEVVSEGKLSQLQLEGVMYACAKHQELLPSGERAGFFIGDGAGVGKGRQIAGIVMDNFTRNRRQAVWLSTSSDLHYDAERDLRALGCHVPVINNCQSLDLAKDSATTRDGVLFMTYTTLVLSGKGRSRLQQVIDWVGGPAWDGCLIFDECHKAKNFTPGKEAASTKVATTVLAIQRQLPRARVVYCSATGVSEVGNLAYMCRLGLWGAGSAFKDFEAFLDTMKRRGVSFLEMLAMEMKAEGYYVARGLSFRQAEFMELHCNLTPEQTALYDAATELWQDLRVRLVEALQLTGTTSRDVWKPYWATQQRFFKLLCISMKVPTVVREAKAALEAGFAVVIGLQSTGEAALDSLNKQPGDECGWVSTTREMLLRFVALHFPTRREVPRANTKPGATSAEAVEQGAEVAECVQSRAHLEDAIEAAKLPSNFLDELIHVLDGPDHVAEMTGRRARVVADERGRVKFRLRAKPDSADMDSLNVRETAAFMRGQKLVAIVSDAASTGISLHASADAVNQHRRIHLTIELPWSADKAIQQLGRSHRSNQVSAPIYKLVVTDVGGERRFAASVARRLQSLGALTRGDRRAASGADLSEYNFDSPLGRKSLRKMYDHILLESELLPNGVNLMDVVEDTPEPEAEEVLAPMALGLRGERGRASAEEMVASVQGLHRRLRDCVDIMGVGVGLPRADHIAEEGITPAAGPASAGTKDVGDVRRFLNRLLGLPVARQNLLFSYFAATLAAEVRSAKAEGRFFEGFSDLGGSLYGDALPQLQPLWKDVHNERAVTFRHDLTLDRGLSFDAALRRLDHERKDGDASGFYTSRHNMFGRSMTVLALQRPGGTNYFCVLRPNTGESYFDMERDELRSKYQPMKRPEDARGGWEEVYQSSLHACMHGTNCNQGPTCQVGRRLTRVTILTGSIVRVWGSLERVLERYQGMLSRSDRTMRVVRADFGAHGSLIGVRYPERLLSDVVATLNAARDASAEAAAATSGVPPGSNPSPAALAAGLPELASAALRAAAMGAGGAMVSEPVAPVDARSYARMLRPPKTMLNFFQPKPKQAEPTAQLGKRKAADAAVDVSLAEKRALRIHS
ncbi:hypothetical protein WJX81_006479 [Elliptochloris bilobata]|uniref:Uncharacterized protein n=1 Tax=Elliptochloris bilobata TaxID=381761 RepID=A0AAW1RI77_9CHLO